MSQQKDQIRSEAPAAEQPQGKAHLNAVSSAPSGKQKPSSGKNVIRLILLVMLVAAAGGTWYWWSTARFIESTDDAYIGGDIAMIAPKVSGYIDQIEVHNNQQVKAGDPLVRLDAGDYDLAVRSAAASLNSQQLAVNTIDAQIAANSASIEQASAKDEAQAAAVRQAELQLARLKKLKAQSFTPQSDLDTAQATLDQAVANRSATKAAIVSARAQTDILKAQRQQAEAALAEAQVALDQARRNQSFTVLKAPYDGIVGNLSAKKGDLVASGTTLMALIPSSELYIDANFKETQLEHLQPGTPVDIKVDAYPDLKLEGRIASIAPAAGSVYSVLPSENATGNFTKVVQRVPVRIALPREELDKGYLRAGFSVEVDIDTRKAPGKESAGNAS